jgi:hypothetical protein
LSKDLPDTTSAAAEEGTLAHEIFEALLTGTRQRVPKGTSPEMAEHIKRCVAWVKDQAGRMDNPQLHCEIQVNPGQALDLDSDVCWGTADVVLYDATDFWVIDLKYGLKPVQAKDNPQLLAYALGALEKFDDTGQALHLAILQPRTEGELVDVWSPDDDEFNGFAGTLASTILSALSPDAPLAPSENACRWCRAAAICPALRKEALEPFEALPDPGAVRGLDDEAVTNLLNRVKLLSSLLDAVQEEALRRALSGHVPQGWKLVESITRRAWDLGSGPQAMLDLILDLKLLGLPVDKLAPATLVSPAQAEKLVSKEQLPTINRFIIKPRGKPTLAPLSDKRPSLAEKDFEALD